MMDFLAVGVFLGTISFCALFSYVMVKFGFKNMSYDEALAAKKSSIQLGYKKEANGFVNKKVKKSLKKKKAKESENNHESTSIAPPTMIETTPLPNVAYPAEEEGEDTISTSATDESEVCVVSQADSDLCACSTTSLDKATPDSDQLVGKIDKESSQPHCPPRPFVNNVISHEKSLDSSSALKSLPPKTMHKSSNTVTSTSKFDENIIQNCRILPSDILGIVRKTDMKSEQIQRLIDALLNKQGRKTSDAAGPWVETGNKGANDLRTLQKHLSDREEALKIEMERSKTAMDRLASQRLELNQAKAFIANSNRIIQKQKTEHDAALASMQAHHSSEKEHQNQMIMNLKKQLQCQVSHTSVLESTVRDFEHKQKQNAIKEATAIEQLKAEREKFDEQMLKSEAMGQQLKGLSQQHKNAVAMSVVSTQKCASLEAECILLRETKCQMEQNYSTAKQELASLHASRNSDIAKLESEINVLRHELSATTINNSLSETKEHQSVASSSLVSVEELKKVQSKLDSCLADKDTMMAKLSEQLKESQAQLEAQQAKNNELRTKNWKVVEALEEAEKTNVKLLKTVENGVGEHMAKGNVLSTIESQREYLTRLAPECCLKSTAVDQNKWLKGFEVAFIEMKKNWEEKLINEQKRASHYKDALAQTEVMLHDLECRVLSEEKERKIDLNQQKQHEDATPDSLSQEMQRMAQTLQDVQTKLSDKQSEIERLKQLCSNIDDNMYDSAEENQLT